MENKNESTNSPKMNSAVAGFHMLMLLADVDGNIDGSEGQVIIKYIRENFPIPVSFDKHIEFLSTLNRDDYFTHFCKAKDDFYQDSTPEERARFFNFAMKMVNADKIITPMENVYINELYTSWESIGA